MKKISMKQILSGSNNHNNVFGDLICGPRYYLNLKKIWHTSQSLLILPVLKTDDRKEFQCLNLVLKVTKLDHYFWNLIDAKTSFSFFGNSKLLYIIIIVIMSHRASRPIRPPRCLTNTFCLVLPLWLLTSST